MHPLFSSRRFCLPCPGAVFLGACLASLALAGEPRALPLQNPGFEEGTAGWNPGQPSEVFQALPEAASLGGKGLRVTAERAGGKKEILSSAAFPAQPGQIFRVSFWGRMQARGVIVRLEFRDKDGKPGAAELTKGFFPNSEVNAERQFDRIVIQGAAPRDAASVAICVDADPRRKAVADLDDFVFEEVPADAAAKAVIPPPVLVEGLLAEVQANPYRGKTPPRIVIKADDLAGAKVSASQKGGVHPRWQKFADAVNQRQIKAGIGIVCKSLEEENPAYWQWVKDLNATGRWEFWLHAYDHEFHLVDGKVYTEFINLPLEEQKKKLALCQQLAKEKLGLVFQTFGPPGGGRPIPGATIGLIKTVMDENTLKALAEDPSLKAILYPSPLDDQARAVDAQGRLTILDRVWTVNIENPTFRPRFDKFLEGYAHNRGRDFFILQGHPMQWDDASFGEFLKIVDFLVAQKAVFVKPAELVRPPVPAK